MPWRRLRYLPVLIAVLLHISLVPAFGLRCKNRIVAIGNTPAEVLSKCGEPTHIEYWEENLRTYFSQLYDDEQDRYVAPKVTKGPLRFECWTYNFGSYRFIRYLLFENNKLIKIDTGEKGHD